VKERHPHWSDGRIYRLCIWISGLALFIMTVVIPIGVFNRYVLGHGSMWPEPLAILCMIIFTFFGAAATYRAGGHIAVTMFTDRVPATIRPAWAVNLLMIGLALFVARYGISPLCGDLGPVYRRVPGAAGRPHLPAAAGGIGPDPALYLEYGLWSAKRPAVVLIGSPGQVSNQDQLQEKEVSMEASS
jgi:hypothetical protein